MMKKITFLMMFFFLAITNVFAQEGLTITGVVADDTGTPLPGADVMVKGTTKGTVTNFDGEFELVSNEEEGTLVVSYVGFIPQELAFSKAKSKFNFTLKSNSLGLKEVMIIASVAVDRKTPVAVSTIKKEEIQLKLGNQEFPEILKSSPGVFVTRNGGGFGDGEVTMRGFNSENVAVLINGVPVNDMESGRVFWSNWAGLGSVTSSVQSQRGLGASKIAVPSVGGTINTITESVDSDKGGLIKFDVGNDGYVKYGAKVSTGLMENGLAATVYADKTTGDNTFADGTNFESISYFLNLSYRINEKHKLAFNAFGAKQRHGQRQNSSLIETYRQSERGIKYNPDWGYNNGQIVNTEDNFYHKPQISLNHYWAINDNNKLSTSAYVSVGTGGGGGTAGDESSKFTNDDYKLGLLGPIDIDRIAQENRDNGINGSSALLRASRNDHFWTGVISTLATDLSDNFVLTSGLDVRYYVGEHYQEVTDLLGGQFYLDNSDINSTNSVKQVGDKINYHDKGYNTQLGGFAQLEYDNENLSGFVSGNISNNRYRREDFFAQLDSDPNQLTDAQDFIGFGGKTGANYRIDDINNVFVNIGYFERAPFLDDVWLNNSNDDLNEGIENQKIFSYELGYGLRSDKLAANLNLYRTLWKNKTETASDGLGDELITANINGLEALHQGIEFDFEYRPFEFLTLTGMVSFGDWKWNNNVTNVFSFDVDRNIVVQTNEDGSNVLDANGNVIPETTDVYLKDIPVGKSAQTTSALGLQFDLTEKTKLAIDYNYYGRYYSDFDLQNRDTEESLNTEPWEVPDYFLFDVVFNHGFKLGEFDAKLTGRINNLFNEEYITGSDDGTTSTAVDALVFYGPGRTFSISSVINF